MDHLTLWFSRVAQADRHGLWYTRADPHQRRLWERLLHGAYHVMWMNLFYSRHPMSEGNRLRALGRLWAWQLWRRIIRRPVVVEIPGEVRIFCPASSIMAGGVATLGLPEPAELVFMMDVVRPQDWVIDVGANLGIYSLLAARRGAFVLAFEPGDNARVALAHSARLNGLGNRIFPQPIALADFSGSAQFTDWLDVNDHLLPDGSSPAAKMVDVTTLDEFLQREPSNAPLGTVVVLKIDAEGADALVLKGARKLIERDKPAIIVEVCDGGRDIRRWLAERSYSVYRYSVAERQLKEIPAQFAGEGNFIGVHRDRLSWIQERLATSLRPLIRPPHIRWAPPATLTEWLRSS